jgi:hypothetical protein
MLFVHFKAARQSLKRNKNRDEKKHKMLEPQRLHRYYSEARFIPKTLENIPQL